MAQERPGDFNFSAPLALEGAASHYRFSLPAQAYRGTARRDLGDVRVFNAAGEPVPYAFAQRDLQRPAPTVQAARLFPLYDDESKGLDSTAVRVERNARGTVVSVSVTDAAPQARRRLLGYLVDPGELKAVKDALVLRWDANEGFTAQARVEGSDDLKSWSTIAANAPIVNSVDYRDTGVILLVTPRVNSGGLVTLDISQEVSNVAANVPSQVTSTLNSPTFDQRLIRTRVAIQDGQTVGLAGLIRDSDSQSNSGIPLLKDIPLLGGLVSSQVNGRQRTELLVLITPRVVKDQRDARSLTEDLRNQLINAGLVRQELQRQPLRGSPNPNRF
jgi:hypothetical protein